ncbi:hypothetical protein, partial [Paraburkholderia sediminicola]|uniref:hypothetical protein n=1 Tax=Paraburkholderia sediminicola TaxID=458836 RepID=UPI0038BC8D6B
APRKATLDRIIEVEFDTGKRATVKIQLGVMREQGAEVSRRIDDCVADHLAPIDDRRRDVRWQCRRCA